MIGRSLFCAKVSSVSRITDPLETLVADIYDAAMAPDLWTRFLERLRGLVRGEFVSIISVHKPSLRAEHMHHTAWPQAAVDDLLQHLPGIPKPDKLLFGMIDTPASALTSMSQDELSRSDFYQHWMAPNGLCDGVHVPIVETAERRILLGFGISNSREPVTGDEMRLVQRLSPHLRRALMIGDTLELTRWDAELALAILAEIKIPILICDAAGHLIFANAFGETAFRYDGPLTMRNGIVEPRSTSVQASFADALRRAATSELALGRRGIGVPLAAPRGAGHAYVLPLMGSDIRRIAETALVAVFVSTHQSQALPEETVLMTLFDLTPAEARVLVRVGQGQSPAQMRETLGVTSNTIKTHLSHIFRKTSCASQAEVVKLMADLALPLSYRQ
jgi:DNA-binding CsgD family transcriptional regulator